MDEDECPGCEGWDEVNDDGYCYSCADQLENDPWMVVDRHSGYVIQRGLTRDQADLIVRVRRPHPHADAPRARVSPMATREKAQLVCGHADMGRPCSVCAAFKAELSDEPF